MQLVPNPRAIPLGLALGTQPRRCTDAPVAEASPGGLRRLLGTLCSPPLCGYRVWWRYSPSTSRGRRGIGFVLAPLPRPRASCALAGLCSAQRSLPCNACTYLIDQTVEEWARNALDDGATTRPTGLRTAYVVGPNSYSYRKQAEVSPDGCGPRMDHAAAGRPLTETMYWWADAHVLPRLRALLPLAARRNSQSTSGRPSPCWCSPGFAWRAFWRFDS